MKNAVTKRNIIIYSLILVLGGSDCGRANAQTGQEIELLSYSFGVVQGQTARITIILPRLANPQLQEEPVSARVQLLDMEGEVIAQSGLIKVLPGQTRYWDQPRSGLAASRDPGGRLQLRARMLVTTLSADLDPSSVMPSIEVIDTLTGGTVYEQGKRFLIFVSGPNGTSQN